MRKLVSIAAACLLGALGSELLYRSAAFRDLVGRAAGRGRLVAITNGRGSYARDLENGDLATPANLVIAENLRRDASNEVIDPSRINQEVSLLRAQFGDDALFARVVSAKDFSRPSLREAIRDQLRGLQWLEKQIVTATGVSEQQLRAYYDAHRERFAQPDRFRASHLFLAAHEEMAPEVIETKARAIDALALRCTGGESFSALVAETSEDEASKSRGGDLGFFCASRVPPEFFAEVEKLTLGEMSKPFQSQMGFHMVQLTGTKPAHLLTFEEARAEIWMALANDQRAATANRLEENLIRSEYFRGDIDLLTRPIDR